MYEYGVMNRIDDLYKKRLELLEKLEDAKIDARLGEEQLEEIDDQIFQEEEKVGFLMEIWEQDDEQQM